MKPAAQRSGADAGAGATPAGQAACALCNSAGGELVWADALLRVILIDEPNWPGFTRVVLHRHVAEMTDLPAHERAAVMDVVWQVETAQRAVLAPHKINLASLGNMVPHLHWHIVPRWRDDICFPDAIWAPPRRSDGQVGEGARRARGLLPRYRQALGAALNERKQSI